MNLQLLNNLIQHLQEFENSNSYTNTSTVEDFRHYLNSVAYAQENPANLEAKFDLELHTLENEIAKQVILLSRYSKMLVKKALDNNKYLVNDDFTYLFRLMDYESLTKSQLIEKNAHEKQSGIEIIKRLVKNGLLAEARDENDRRSVRISVTKKGRRVFFETIEGITTVAHIMTGKLSKAEKEIFLEHLKKLNTFHNTVYLKNKQLRLEEIEQMI